jgi:hypothetical protein
MPKKASVILRSAPFETPPAAAPQDKLARLEGRKNSMQPDNFESLVKGEAPEFRRIVAVSCGGNNSPTGA